MSRRTLMNRYSPYPWNPASVRGPIPPWLKTFGHRLERQAVREAINTGDWDMPRKRKDIKGRIFWMWY